MAKLPAAFDSNRYDDMQSAFEPIPRGTYLAQITGSDIRQTAAKNGQYIWLEFTILDGEYKGRKIWTNLNIINPNPVAVEIAQKELATICRAVGKFQVNDTAELHGVPLMLKVGIQPAKGDYPASNKPMGYAPASEKTPSSTKKKKGKTSVPWG